MELNDWSAELESLRAEGERLRTAASTALAELSELAAVPETDIVARLDEAGLLAALDFEAATEAGPLPTGEQLVREIEVAVVRAMAERRSPAPDPADPQAAIAALMSLLQTYGGGAPVPERVESVDRVLAVSALNGGVTRIEADAAWAARQRPDELAAALVPLARLAQRRSDRSGRFRDGGVGE